MTAFDTRFSVVGVPRARCESWSQSAGLLPSFYCRYSRSSIARSRSAIEGSIRISVFRASALICDRLVVLHRGRVAAAGTPWEVLTPQLLAEVYEVDAEVTPDPRTGAPHLWFRAPTVPH